MITRTGNEAGRTVHHANRVFEVEVSFESFLLLRSARIALSLSRSVT